MPTRRPHLFALLSAIVALTPGMAIGVWPGACGASGAGIEAVARTSTLPPSAIVGVSAAIAPKSAKK